MKDMSKYKDDFGKGINKLETKLQENNEIFGTQSGAQIDGGMEGLSVCRGWSWFLGG